MKNNISLIAFTFFFSQPWAHSERITFENIDPKSFQEFVRPQTPPKVEVVTPVTKVVPVNKAIPATVVPVPKVVPVTKAAPVSNPPISPKTETAKSQIQSVPQSRFSENKTLVIGDSLSSSYGKFGPGVAEALSKNGNEACLYSVSGSRFDQWTGGYTMKNPVGSSEIYYKDGKGKSLNYTKNDSTPQSWNLEKLLSSHSCGNPQKKFTNLVIQLGSNHSEDYSPVKDLEKIFNLAKANGIQDIKFILPPNGSRSKHQELCNKIKFFLSKENGVKASFFDTVNRVAIQNKDLGDGVHFYNTPSEKNWTTAVQSWIQDSSRLAIEKELIDNPEHRTVKN
jgi:hypothetical protein